MTDNQASLDFAVARIQEKMTDTPSDLVAVHKDDLRALLGLYFERYRPQTSSHSEG